ncbi:MAG: hypothetical protein WC878_07145 [Candidatus Paceibacterota bacterium]|jgi:hypothetical protein
MKTYVKSGRFFAIASLLFFGFFFSAGPIFAQQTASVKIQPGIIEKKADPGKEYPEVLRATNTGTVAQTYTVIVENIDSIDASGRPVFATKQETTGFEMSSWVKISNPIVTVGPKETVDIPFIVSVPKDATPGGHFGTIFLSTDGKKPENIGATVGYQVGALLSYQISGDVIEIAEIREFTSDKTMYGDTKVVFNVKVKNTGNSLARPRGMIEILDMFGKNVTTVKLNDSGAAVFPKSEREFTVTWQDDKMHLGKYTAIASMTYGFDVRHTMFSQIGFYIMPMNVVTPVLGFLFLVALVLYISVKLYIRKKMKEYGITSKTAKAHSSEFSSRGTVMFLAFVAFVVIFFLALFAIMA